VGEQSTAGLGGGAAVVAQAGLPRLQRLEASLLGQWHPPVLHAYPALRLRCSPAIQGVPYNCDQAGQVCSKSERYPGMW